VLPVRAPPKRERERGRVVKFMVVAMEVVVWVVGVMVMKGIKVEEIVVFVVKPLN